MNPVMLAIAVAVAVIVILGHWLRARLWGEKPSKEPEKTVAAMVISKEVVAGTHGAGRSQGGYSYTVTFSAQDGQLIKLFARETEFGGLKEGTQGKLTYKGRYFVRFEE